jgi:hypothetical protein
MYCYNEKSARIHVGRGLIQGWLSQPLRGGAEPLSTCNINGPVLSVNNIVVIAPDVTPVTAVYRVTSKTKCHNRQILIIK